jgi:hypothetical protein
MREDFPVPVMPTMAMLKLFSKSGAFCLYLSLALWSRSSVASIGSEKSRSFCSCDRSSEVEFCSERQVKCVRMGARLTIRV